MRASCCFAHRLFVPLLAGLCFAAEAAEIPAPVLQRLERSFLEAREKYLKNSNDVQATWQFGRASFDWADYARTDAQREPIAQEGIAACRRAIELDSKSAPAHFYLAFNLGQLAKTKLLGALKLVDEMEREFLAAIELDPKFNHASPHHFLGQLYRDAPGWPASIGSRSKARFHLEKAVELDPGFPGNRLTLLESYLKWGENNKVKAQIESTEKLLQQARQELAGEAWALEWLEWDEIWNKIKAGLATPKAGSPRQSN